MSLTTHHLFGNSPSRITFYFTTPISLSLQNPNISPRILSRHLATSFHCQTFRYKPKSSLNFTLKSNSFPLKAYQYDGVVPTPSSDGFNLDAFLSIAEILCIISSAVVTVCYAVNSTFLSSKRTVFAVIGSNRALAWGLVVMMGGVLIGALIRKRQWLRFCRVTVREGRESVNLVERIEKLEEDLRSSATIIRVLSRQLEKLGIRFRVTRKALKEPIAETAALAKKNSEATRALAMQEDILEKELGEIQKVLLAMQEQQEKQLELILAIGKSGKLWESRQEPSQQQGLNETSELTKGAKQSETHKVQSSNSIKGINNDRP
ncbi:hypothetical protein JCGZ_18648 [Jatropha curcas]|uniref:Transmembrane protein n=1 Tax=Jatropha curcas TaxID=180498 RepID=A0A067K3Y0_JATCU|nr:uncharacterized protein LOC105641632 [Jatropha curcas]XP_012081608.1 uncharacterized protein LOC105641632 [Jatropha curcas]KDP29713.1 hypothetical protein JCGZ_18648 [Jatropha curcas]